jgi:DME family drug/metabolite transporter
MNRPTITGWPLVMGAAMLWGTDLVLRPPVLALGRAAGNLSSATLVLDEHILLFLIFLPILILTRKSWGKLNAAEWGAMLFIGWGGSAIATVLYTQAFMSGNPVTVMLLQKTQPLFALVLAGVVLKERRMPWFWLWAAVALTGTILLIFGDHTVGTLASQFASGTAGMPLKSRACALGAAALWGTGTVVGRKMTARLPAGAIAGWRFTLAIPLLLVMIAFSGGFHAAAPLTQTESLYVLGIVLIPDVIGMSLYYIGLRATPASIATLAELAYPATALAIGFFTGQTALSILQWFGFAVLCVSVYAMQTTRAVSVAPLVRSNFPVAASD